MPSFRAIRSFLSVPPLQDHCSCHVRPFCLLRAEDRETLDRGGQSIVGNQFVYAADTALERVADKAVADSRSAFCRGFLSCDGQGAHSK